MKISLHLLLFLLVNSLGAQIVTVQKGTNGKMALFKDGKQKSEYIYDWVPNDADTITQKNFPASVNGKWIFLNQKLKCITDSADYLDTTVYFMEMKAPIRVGNYWNVVSAGSGFFLSRFIPDSEFYYFEDDEVVVRITNGRAFYAPKRGKWVEMFANKSEEVYIYPLQYGERINFDYTTNTAKFRREKYGMIDREGHIKIKPEWDEIRDVSEFGLVVRKGNKFGVIDTSGNARCSFIYEDLGGFSGSFPHYAAAKQNGKYGYIDTNFQWRIQPEFDYAGYFYNAMALVAKNGLYGMINYDKSIRVPLKYKNLRDCYTCLLAFDGINYQLLSYGNQPQSELYNYMDYMYNGVFKVSVGQKFGLIDDKGKWLLPAEYDQIESVYPRVKITKGTEVKFYNYIRKVIEDK